MEITIIKNIEFLIVSMGTEKGFDSLDLNILISALEKYGFGENVILSVKILLQDTESRVINGGKSTK